MAAAAFFGAGLALLPAGAVACGGMSHACALLRGGELTDAGQTVLAALAILVVGVAAGAVIGGMFGIYAAPAVAATVALQRWTRRPAPTLPMLRLRVRIVIALVICLLFQRIWHQRLEFGARMLPPLAVGLVFSAMAWATVEWILPAPRQTPIQRRLAEVTNAHSGRSEKKPGAHER